MQGSLSDPRWIGYGSTTHEDIYMSDGSYVQVLNEMYPGKVSLVSDDHSAMTTATAGTWKSKWGPYVLCEHTRYNSPYDATSVKYYVSTSIAGSTDALCNTSSRVFTAVSIQNATYSWSVGPGLSKTENGNSCTVNGNGYSTGSTWIEVTITSPIGGGQYDVKTSPRLNFWLGTEAITVYSEGGDGGYVDNSYYFWVSSYSGDLEWYVYPIGDLTDLGGGLASIYFDTPGLAYIWVIDTDECGESEPEFFEFEVYGDYLLSPNPASDHVTISPKNSNSDYLTADNIYTVSILDMYGSLKSQSKHSGGSFVIPVRNLKDGMYFIKINNGKTSVTKHLIIKH
jgi:hypothetical protein